LDWLRLNYPYLENSINGEETEEGKGKSEIKNEETEPKQDPFKIDEEDLLTEEDPFSYGTYGDVYLGIYENAPVVVKKCTRSTEKDFTNEWTTMK
jgi:hypothetical protein